jgi:hypothetical protein
MKLNKEQCSIVSDRVWGIVKYRETYEEVYDHILTAIEQHYDGKKSVYDLTEQLINQEFGSSEGIKQLEAEREKIIKSAINKKQWKYVLNHFRFPLIAFTLILAVASYFFIDTYISRKALFLIVFIVALVPFLACCSRWLKQGIGHKKTKRSVKDNVILNNSYFALNFINVINFVPALFMPDDDYKLFHSAHASVLAVIVVFYVVYTLSFIRMYREEMSMQVIS